MRTIAFGLIILVLLLISLLIAAFISGKNDRSYLVLDPAEKIVITGEESTVKDVVEKYKPIIRIRSTTPSLPLLVIKYNVVQIGEKLDIVYYFVWQDEIHPNPFINKLYWLFRAAYYGVPVRDIEYFQLSIDTRTGEVTGILFETSPGDDYFVRYSKHLIARYELLSGSRYIETISDRSDGTLISRQVVELQIIGGRADVGVITWNHLVRLIDDSMDDFDLRLDANLEFLTDKEYRDGKYVRKSQGDHKTKEDPVSYLLGASFSVLFFIISGLFFYRVIISRRGKRHAQQ